MKKLLPVLIAFVLGIATMSIYQAVATSVQSPTYDGFELPSQVYADITGSAIARPTPGDHITEDQILVYPDRVILDIPDAVWARFTPTASMDPVLDEKSNAIEIIPESEEQINEGDIIAYTSDFAEGIIIHRVIKKGEDQLGTYYLVKGDNNPTADPGKVRFEDIKSVVVAIIY